MPPIKVKYRGEIHEIDWTDKRKPTKEELRLAISNDILKKEAPAPLTSGYQLPEPQKPPSPSIFTPKTKIQKFVETFEPDAFDPVRRDRSMFSVDQDKLTDIASRAPESIRKPVAIAGSMAGTAAELFSDPETVLVPGAFGAARRGVPRALPELPKPIATPLELPNTPRNFADDIVEPGSRTYGITPKDQFDDPLLAHVPNRYRPTPTQSYFDQMLPSAIRERVKGAEQLGEDAVPEIIERSARQIREQRGITNKVDDVANDIQSRAREVAEKSNVPEFKSTIDEVGDDIHNVSDDPASSLSASNLAAAKAAKEKQNLNYARKSMFESGDTELKNMGEPGKELWRLVVDRDHLIRR